MTDREQIRKEIVEEVKQSDIILEENFESEWELKNHNRFQIETSGFELDELNKIVNKFNEIKNVYIGVVPIERNNIRFELK